MATQNSSMGDTFRDLRELVVGYAKQETVDPLNKLKHYLGFGIPGALLLTLGLYLVSLGILRGLQHLSWTSAGFGSLVPYLGSLVFLIVVMVICFKKASTSMKAGDDGRRKPPA